MGTTKIQHPNPPPKEKEPGHPGCMLPQLIGSKNCFLPMCALCHFWPRLMAMARTIECIILTCPNSTAWLWTCISDLCSAARTSLLRLPFHFADHKKNAQCIRSWSVCACKACDVGKSISSHNSKLACTHSLRWSATDCIAWMKLSLRPANMSPRAGTKQSYCFWLANVVTFKWSEAFYSPLKKE
jgi:hypothetical protein